jgi:hypothetical protein
LSEISFPSTGDAEEDRRTAERIVTTDRRLSEAMCPNGCGPLKRIDTAGYEAQCQSPDCYFVAGGNSPRFACLEYAPERTRPFEVAS